jgi:hypothetical protein
LSTGDYCNTAVLPLLTIVTVGIVPTVWTETQCDGALFRAGRETDTSFTGTRVIVRTRREGRALLGWAALPLMLFPGWSRHLGREQTAYQQAFKLEILKHRAELMAAAGRTP